MTDPTQRTAESIMDLIYVYATDYGRHLNAEAGHRTLALKEWRESREALKDALAQVCRERDEALTRIAVLEEAVLKSWKGSMPNGESFCRQCDRHFWNQAMEPHYHECLVLDIQRRRAEMNPSKPGRD